jgi:flagellar hook-associated protein 1 FlgK
MPTFSVPLSGLTASSTALSAIANNLANLNTVGFSRQQPVLEENYPIVVGSLTFGSGVKLGKLQAIRDPILELRINAEAQQTGRYDAALEAMQQAQVMFSGSGADVGSQLTAFFNSWNQLSTDPMSTSLRQNVLTAAGNLASAFHTSSANLSAQQTNLDLSVSQAVQQVNALTGKIADLNGQIAGLQNLNEDASAFIDQRGILIQQLSSLIDVSVVQSESGLTLTTSSGAALVAGQQGFSLNTQLSSSGLQHVFSSSGDDITDKISGGQLAGLIGVRDHKIPQLLTQLDTLASGLSNAVNVAHQAGYDLNGAGGGDLFQPPAADGKGAAASMAVLISDPSLLAASSDPTAPGSNGNIAQLYDVSSQAVADGKTPADLYSGIVFQVGSDVADTSAQADASKLILQQLQDQRASLSGVSLDEEAANLVRYQRAFEAAARVVSTVSEMLDTAIHLGQA